YADATIILCASKEAHSAINTIQKYLSLITKWASKWCITLNASKTVHVLFSRRSTVNLIGPKSPSMNGVEIKNETKYRYLGLLLDRKLILHLHTTQLINRLRSTAFGLNWILGNQSKLPKSIKITLYKQLIAPVWQYALPIWGSLISNTRFKQIEATQNKIIRLIVKASRYIRNQDIRELYDIKSAENIFHQASNRLAASLSCHPNPEAIQLNGLDIKHNWNVIFCP
ncbi:hypothetical protein M5D96_011972, partial [Drosophila gunungcola]